MLLFVTIVHFLVAVLLVVFVLLQDSKGGGVFGMGSSGGGQVFSATGAANFFAKTTRWLAIAFAITSVSLTYMTTHKSGSVLDTLPATSAPATPATTPDATATPAASTPAENTAGEAAPTKTEEKK